METEELIHKCKAISLEEGKANKVVVGNVMAGNGRKLMKGCLLGKVLHQRGLSREGLRSALQQVWRTADELKIEKLGSKIFMFKFAFAIDKKRVLSSGPWHFERVLIVLKQPSGIGEIMKQSFTHATFWVQLHNVLVGCMDQEIIGVLGKAIGIVEEVDADEEGECTGQYARVRISIDITQPLQKIIYLDQEGAKDVPIPVVYERLPEFCLCCGLIGHQYKECEKYKGQSKDKLAYGVWMQAAPLFGKFRTSRFSERGPKAHDKIVNQVTKSNHKNSRGNPDPQHQQSSPSHKGNTTEPGTDLNQEDTHVAANRGSNVKEGGEMQLMPSRHESIEQMIDYNKQPLAPDKEKAPRKTSSKVGKTYGKERECEKFTTEETSIDARPDPQVKAQDNGEEEEGVDDGPNSTQLKRNKKNWKRQARKQNEKGASKQGTHLTKRSHYAPTGMSPNQKRSKVSPVKQTQRQVQHHSPSAKLQLTWEVMAAEDMEVSMPVITDISAEAGGQPRRQP